VTTFTDDLVRALAEAGEYSRPEVTRYVEETFIKRRDKIGEYWFDLITPLEAFELELDSKTWTLRFQDLAIDRGYAAAEDRVYHFEVKDALNLASLSKGQSRETGLVRIEPIADLPPAPTDRWGRTPLAVLEVRSNRQDGDLALPVKVVIGFQNGRRKPPRVLGWSHAPKE
jgi:hypothetical protein